MIANALLLSLDLLWFNYNSYFVYFQPLVKISTINITVSINVVHSVKEVS